MVNWEVLLDGLTTIDDKLATANNHLSAIRDGVGGQPQDTDQIISESGEAIRKKRVISLTTLVQGNDNDFDSEPMPFNGFVDSVILGWPDGSVYSVGVKITDDKTGEQYIPDGEDEYMSFDSFTGPFDTTFPIYKGREVRADVVNNINSPVPINVALMCHQKRRDETMEQIEARLG